jgi:hypothetical protein
MRHLIPCALIAIAAFLLPTPARAAEPCPESQKILGSDIAAVDYFGWSSALRGDLAIVGAPHEIFGGPGPGAAYIYRFDGTLWIQEQKLTPSDGADTDQFGFSVAIDGNVAIVGAARKNGAGNDAGAAYIFRFNGSAWIQEQKLTHPAPAAIDWFGQSVAIEGNVAAIGVPRDEDTGNDRGAVFVYRFDGVTWNQEQKLKASDNANDDWFGHTIAISGNALLIGSLLDDQGGPAFDAGSAYVFRDNGSTWVEEAKLNNPDGSQSDWFSYGLAISGDVAVVDSRFEDHNGVLNSGAAYVFRFNGAAWTMEKKLTASDAIENDEYGFSVGVDGDNIIVGAKFSNVGIADTGAAYTYHHDGADWIGEQKYLASDGVDEDNFGWSVAISGPHAIVGAINENQAGPAAGAAYALNLTACGCPTDITGDAVTDGADLGLLLANWGGTGDGDLNNDGTVDGADLGLLLSSWGGCP